MYIASIFCQANMLHHSSVINKIVINMMLIEAMYKKVVAQLRGFPAA